MRTKRFPYRAISSVLVMVYSEVEGTDGGLSRAAGLEGGQL
jgi:hypothetical protein